MSLGWRWVFKMEEHLRENEKSHPPWIRSILYASVPCLESCVVPKFRRDKTAFFELSRVHISMPQIQLCILRIILRREYNDRPGHKANELAGNSGVLNDQIFKKALFRFRTANWYLLSVLWLTINFPGKKIAAPQSQQDEVQRIPFASKQIL